MKLHAIFCYLVLRLIHSANYFWDCGFKVHEWHDDFAYSSDSNGWDNNKIINGTIRKYHGWFASNNITFSRKFRSQCGGGLNWDIFFTVYYACDIDKSDGVTLYLNDEPVIKASYLNDQDQSQESYVVLDEQAVLIFTDVPLQPLTLNSTCDAAENNRRKKSHNTIGSFVLE